MRSRVELFTLPHYSAGKNLLTDPLFNKGLGFPRAERDRLGVRGLIPSQMLNVQEQEKVRFILLL